VRNDRESEFSMEKDKIKSLLRQTTGVPERQPDCPQDELLATYMEGGFSDASHREFEAHLADCAWCLERVGILGRANESDTQEQVPELLIARAGRIPNPSRESVSKWHRAPALAAAAVLVLTLGALVSNLAFRDKAPDPASSGNMETTQSTRSVDPGGLQPAQHSPVNNISVKFVGGMFEWTPVNDSMFYQVRIVTAEGDLLWRERVSGDKWKPPGGLVFSPGEEYFVFSRDTGFCPQPGTSAIGRRRQAISPTRPRSRPATI